eukprot:CAMPEP_0117645366 /NCGR_PEP_ID=MMETSP0802-20121206/11508_1 /TAXON_ID=38833 /ORGANISM="Micromonas sp., Strain CCMP2099" /LENGTH=190 /DNA_ID=CAMNT_0005450733 /DNA_START=85 /DNA_END=655 /DNA_ORIENTATION=+
MTAVSGDIATGTAPASLADAQEAIPGLPDHLVVEHVLRSEVLRDPILLARLRAVSHAMRSAVAATGREVKNPGYDFEAAKLGFRSTLKHRQSRGRLSRRESLCEAAARSGRLAVGPWDVHVGGVWRESRGAAVGTRERLPVGRGDMYVAAEGGHLEVLQWARATGCPWDEETCEYAAGGRHLEVLQWAHA